MPLPTRLRGASAAPRFRGGSARRLGCPPLRTVVIEPGLKTPMVALETPRPRGPAAPAAVSPQTPSSGSDRRAAAGFPPADIPVVMTSVAPPPPALAGSSPFGRSWSCHPRVPLGEGWKRPVAVASSGCPCDSLAVSGAAIPPAPASPRANSLCSSSQQRKHVTVRAKTLSVTDPWPIRVGFPCPGAPWEM